MRREITRELAADAVQRKAVVYDRQGDAHYDVISRVHQVDPRVGPRRGALLARADDRGGGGPALHRAPSDRARVGGHRARRPDGAAASRRRGAGRRARRAARGTAEPRPGDPLPRARREVEQRRTRRSRRRSRTPRRPTPSQLISATPPTPARRSSATGRATSTRTTNPATGPTRSTGPSATEATATTSPPSMGDDTKDWVPGSGPAGPSRRDPSTG